MEDINCPVCFNVFLSQSSTIDRKPNICCHNGHTVCADCFTRLKTYESDMTCPNCREPLLECPIVNRILLDIIDNLAKEFNRVPEINVDEMTISAKPFASGAFADVYDARWHNQGVAVKALRMITEFKKQLEQLRLEANLAIGLHHPNIVRLFGTTKLDGDRFGIVMEKVDNGSLDMHMFKLNQEMLVEVSLGIIDGLQYVHSRKVAHRDLKPENVLLSGPQMIPKISDFGVSKVIQTIITNTAMVGTPKYVAPELLEEGRQYGYSVDIFSLSVIFYEMFSGVPAEQSLGSTMLQIIFAVSKGKRPQIPQQFPSALRPLIERGWAQDPAARAGLKEFRVALLSMINATSSTLPQTQHPQNSKRVSKLDQSEQVAKVSFPLPVLFLKWNSDCEMLNSAQLRIAMIEDLKTKSNMKNIINNSVLSVMKVIPRHLFVEEKRMAAFAGGGSRLSQQELVTASYLYCKPIPATMDTNESSPEIIGTQLSLTEIIQGHSVLLVGMKGGYIQSLVAQLVGLNGSVVTVTSNRTAMDVCRDRVNMFCPFKSIIKWIQVNDVNNPKNVVSDMQKNQMLFHTIIYCGSVDIFPTEVISILHTNGNVSIMAPVKTGSGDGKQLQLYLRREGIPEHKTITDFGVLFEDVK